MCFTTIHELEQQIIIFQEEINDIVCPTVSSILLSFFLRHYHILTSKYFYHIKLSKLI